MRQTQRAAARKAASKLQQSASPASESDTEGADPVTASPSPSSDDALPSPPPAKRRKIAPAKSKPPTPKQPQPQPKAPKARAKPKPKSAALTLLAPLPSDIHPPLPPLRNHPLPYHHPLLLTSPASRTALLTWFTTVQSTRLMPWRKAFLPAGTAPRAALAKRAYEVWISEIMLQQTRVAAVIGYWNRWMDKWPTIEDLAAAGADDVLSAWQGLGYYSRAKRVHEAAGIVCADEEMRGLLPAEVEVLEKRVPGVGRYTAGAIAAIVFGKAAAMVDGNVLRVLSRQLGVWGDVKERVVVEALWEVADALAKAVARDGVEEGEETPLSDRPGRWGQALMELGSTLCTPKPDCAACPITATCRAYQEGYALATGGKKRREVDDIEDLCTICSPWEEDAEADDDDDDDDTEPDAAKGKRKPNGRQLTVSAFFAAVPSTTSKANGAVAGGPDARTIKTIVNHTRKFPLRKPKKKVREEVALVCAIRRSSDGAYLIHQRPEKGLLGGMWELPSHTLLSTTEDSKAAREQASTEYVTGLLSAGKNGTVAGKGKRKRGETSGLYYRFGEAAMVPWAFSHLKLTMYIHMFAFDDQGAAGQDTDGPRRKWASIEEMDRVSMGTGMRNCWEMVGRLGKAWATDRSDDKWEAL